MRSFIICIFSLLLWPIAYSLELVAEQLPVKFNSFPGSNRCTTLLANPFSGLATRSTYFLNGIIALTDQQNIVFAMGEPLLKHSALLKKIAQKGLGTTVNVLWAGELQFDGRQFVAANETAGIRRERRDLFIGPTGVDSFVRLFRSNALTAKLLSDNFKQIRYSELRVHLSNDLEISQKLRHDLNNILASISGFQSLSELKIEKAHAPGKISKMAREALRLVALIRETQTYSLETLGFINSLENQIKTIMETDSLLPLEQGSLLVRDCHSVNNIFNNGQHFIMELH